MLPKREDALRGSKKGSKVCHDLAILRYYKNPVFCKYCHQIIKIRDGEVPSATRKKKFCNSSCFAIYNNTGRIKVEKHKCLNCGLICNYPNFCKRECQLIFNYNDYIRRWKAGQTTGARHINSCSLNSYVRRYIFKKYNSQCCKCGWAEVNKTTNKTPLQINHVNGNCIDNIENNLELLCPNCHSLTPTFGSLNETGKGRRILLKKFKKSA